MSDGWCCKRTAIVFENPHLQVAENDWDTPTRKGVSWLTVHRKEAVVVAPRTAEGQFLLICEERPAVQETLWAFPAGQVDVPKDTISEITLLDTARRELLEETGHASADLQLLGHYHSSPGFTSECLHLILADKVAPAEGGALPEGTECILDQRLVTPEELRAMVLSGELRDGSSLAMYAQLSARGYLS